MNQLEIKIQDLASNYHERSPSASFYDDAGSKCDCCGLLKHESVESIEHDSLDYSLDKGVCTSCYTQIRKIWVDNGEMKIPPQFRRIQK